MQELQTGAPTGQCHHDSEAGAIRLSFDLPEAVPFIKHLRRTSRSLMDSFGLSAQDADDLELMIGELATNAARHAHCDNYRVTIELSPNQAKVTVTDRGEGFAPEQVLAPGALRPDTLSKTASERIGGFGLPLVMSLSDHVDIHRNQPRGMTICAEKRLHAEN